MAEQVALDFSEHDQPVQDEAVRNRAKLRKQVQRIDSVAAVCGATGAARLDHLDDHGARARALVERWLAQTVPVTAAAEVPSKAFARIDSRRAPAAQGKDSSKDYLVYASRR